jgi:quinol monooxygenase YgiN
MVICTFEILFDSRLVRGATHLLRTLQGPVRSESGCRGTSLYCDLDDGERIVWISRWEDWECFEKHVRAPRFRKLLGVLEMASRQPAILIERSEKEQGIDAIAGILMPPGSDDASIWNLPAGGS